MVGARSKQAEVVYLQEGEDDVLEVHDESKEREDFLLFGFDPPPLRSLAPLSHSSMARESEEKCENPTFALKLHDP